MKETTVSKRPREAEAEEEEVDSGEAAEYTKRHRPYHHILSLLESEEEEPTQDLSSLISSLQQEISIEPETHQPQESGQHNPSTTTITTTTSEDHSDSALQSKGHKEDEEEKENMERIMRHLLEASDDELGIPNTGDNNGFVGLSSGDDDRFQGYPFCDGLWELEDETANYYALLQSQLFM